MYSPSIKKLIEEFSKLPGVGPRAAARIVFYLIKKDAASSSRLAAAIIDLKKEVKTCRLCFNVYESEKEICAICADPKRNKDVLCVVASETDLASIEKLKTYRGLYFVLGGLRSGFKSSQDRFLRTAELSKTIGANKALREVILALNPTSEGQSTIIFLEGLLKPCGVKISRLALGIPFGGELEYADEDTLNSALEGRK
jgi:recombination protein RecR